MDPKEIVKGQAGWLDIADLKDYGKPGQQGFYRVLVHADGSKTLEVYQRGVEGGPIHTQVLPDKDPEQAAIWQKNAPVQTSTAVSGTTQTTTSQRLDPVTGQPTGPKYVTAVGPAPAAQQEQKGQKTTLENGEWVIREIEADGSQGRIVGQKPAKPDEVAAFTQNGVTGIDRKPVAGGLIQVTTVKKDAAGNSTSAVTFEDFAGNPAPAPGSQTVTSQDKEPVPNHPGMFVVKKGAKNPDGSTVSDTYYVDAAGNRIAGPAAEGNWQPKTDDPNILINTKTGETKSIGTGAPGTDIGELKLEAGQISNELTRAFNAANARRIRGEITQQQMADELKPIVDLGNARINEINGILGTQRSIYSDESANMRQRSVAAQSIFQNAFTNTAAINPYLQPGSDKGGKALLAQLALGLQYQNMFAPAPTMGAALEQSKSLGLGGSFPNGQPQAATANTGGVTINIGAGGGQPQQPQIQGPDLSNPLALGMARQGVQQQAKDMTMQQVKDDPFFSGVLGAFAGGTPEGLTTSDQLRAPSGL